MTSLNRAFSGEVNRIYVTLEGTGVCGDGVSPRLTLVVPGIDWGLQVGSELQVKLFGNTDPLDPGKHGAVVLDSDEAFLAAAFDDIDEFLTPFLDRIPTPIRFEQDCAYVASGSAAPPCYETTIQESLVLSDGRVLRAYESVKVPAAGMTLHVALTQAWHYSGSLTGLCRAGHTPAPGHSYQFFVARVP